MRLFTSEYNIKSKNNNIDELHGFLNTHVKVKDSKCNTFLNSHGNVIYCQIEYFVTISFKVWMVVSKGNIFLAVDMYGGNNLVVNEKVFIKDEHLRRNLYGHFIRSKAGYVKYTVPDELYKMKPKPVQPEIRLTQSLKFSKYFRNNRYYLNSERFFYYVDDFDKNFLGAFQRIGQIMDNRYFTGKKRYLKPKS